MKTKKFTPAKFLKEVQKLKKQKDFTYTDDAGKVWTGEMAIAKHFGMTRSEFRAKVKEANASEAPVIPDKDLEAPVSLPVNMKWIPAESYSKDGRYYMQLPDGLRLIFDADGYVGHYMP